MCFKLGTRFVLPFFRAAVFCDIRSASVVGSTKAGTVELSGKLSSNSTPIESLRYEFQLETVLLFGEVVGSIICFLAREIESSTPSTRAYHGVKDTSAKELVV